MEKQSKPFQKQLTPEQLAIINSTGDITINAVAGSGKTTTIIEYAAARPVNSKILYLAFNKSVKLEAARKFADKGLNNVKVETAHSVAYHHIVRNSKYKVKSAGYKIHEIVDVLNLQGDGTKHTEYIVANHINKFITYFCNSDQSKVQDLNYLDTISEMKAKNFVHSFYRHIEDGTRMFLAKMDKAEIEITHDFYLKKFQLFNPQLPYDYILFDEGQDASGAMLDVFLQQKAVKVIVGDTHQQIYGWRHAVNSLAKTNFPTLQLSVSFRFPQDIADLATGILDWKHHLSSYKPVTITGNGTSKSKKSIVTIARTNLGLLLSAINFITDNRKAKHIYFEGNINSYTYADDGASLYDVLNLSNGKYDRIRDKLILSMKDMDELEEYVKSTEDVQLGMMIEIVDEYGDGIYDILKTLKSMQTGDEEREKAEMIFSTVHKAKGMEYDTVHLVNDFLSETKLERLISEAKKEKQPLNIAKLNEEINLLYVAVTRAKHHIHMPELLMPKDFPASPYIHLIKPLIEPDKRIVALNEPGHKYLRSKKTSSPKPTGKQLKEKAYSVERKREINKDAYKPWSTASDKELINLFESDNPISAIASHFGRTRGAVISRLKKLGCYEE